MSEDLDRRIAIEIFKEEPPSPAKTMGGPTCISFSPARAWSIESGNFLLSEWEPLPFSSDLGEALRAVEKARETHPGGLILMQNGETRAWTVGGLGAKNWERNQILEVAICNLLLALKEKEKK